MDDTQKNPVSSSAYVPIDKRPLPPPSTITSNKEHEPFAKSELKTEVVKPVEQGPELPKEVQEAGVEAISEKPEIPSDLQKAGVVPSKELTNVNPSSNGVATPTLDPRAVIKQNRNNPSKSIVWMMQIYLKNIKRKLLGGPREI